MEEDKNQAQNNPIKMLQEKNNIRKKQITISEENTALGLGSQGVCLRVSRASCRNKELGMLNSCNKNGHVIVYRLAICS
jgi:hypothetical protein